MDAFLLKKLVSNLVHLVPGAFFALLVLWVLLRKWPRVSKWAMLMIILSLIALSSPRVSNLLVKPLETAYPVIPELSDDIGLVLVLGAGFNWKSEYPPNSVLSSIALSRLHEGVRLFNTNPEVFLMVTGARFGNPISMAEAMGNMAIAMGVAPERIIYADEARDTDDEITAAAEWIEQFGKGRAVVIVSSATHLTRAGLLAETSGLEYQLAPTDFRMARSPWYRFNVQNLVTVDYVIHEYIGMLWHHLTAQR